MNTKWYYVRTNKSHGWVITPDTMAELLIRIENCGHEVKECRVIESHEPNGDCPDKFVF